MACDIPSDCTCPMCKAPVDYLTWNNGKAKTQILFKVCQTKFSPGNNNRFSQTYKLKCPYCSHSLVPKKNRKHFIVHKCVNPKCSYYLCNLRKVDKEDLEEDYGKNKYKLHYIYREFTIDFFKMDLSSLPKNASSLKFKQHDSYIMSLCLTYRVNLGLSLRKTAQAPKDIHGIKISHQQVANYCTTAAICVKPFTDSYDYKAGNVLTADETYIKIRGVKGYIWFIMDAAKRSILGYQISDNRGVGPCILSMRMAFKHFKDKLPEHFKFIADGYSAYPLAAQQFLLQFGEKFKFDITQVIGLKKESYRPTNGFDNIEGANYDLALWVTYYNFLRPHKHNGYRVLNHVQELDNADNMPGKWQLLIYLGQCKIKQMQQDETHNCS